MMGEFAAYLKAKEFEERTGSETSRPWREAPGGASKKQRVRSKGV